MPLKLEKARLTKTAPDWSGAIYRLRDDKGWSQKSLARELSVEPTSVARWEMGVREPDKWNYLQMLLLSHGSLRSFFEVKVGRTVEQIIEDLNRDGRELRRIADEKGNGEALITVGTSTRQQAHQDGYYKLREDLAAVIASGQSQLINQAEETLDRLADDARRMSRKIKSKK